MRTIYLSGSFEDFPGTVCVATKWDVDETVGLLITKSRRERQANCANAWNEWTEPLLADCRRSNTLGSQRSADRHARYYGNERQRAPAGLHAHTRLLEGAPYASRAGLIMYSMCVVEVGACVRTHVVFKDVRANAMSVDYKWSRWESTNRDVEKTKREKNLPLAFPVSLFPFLLSVARSFLFFYLEIEARHATSQLNLKIPTLCSRGRWFEILCSLSQEIDDGDWDGVWQKGKSRGNRGASGNVRHPLLSAVGRALPSWVTGWFSILDSVRSNRLPARAASIPVSHHAPTLDVR